MSDDSQEKKPLIDSDYVGLRTDDTNVESVFPETIDGKPSTGQIASTNGLGLLGVVYDPSGHEIGIYDYQFLLDSYGFISPAVICPVCNWTSRVRINHEPPELDDDNA